MRKLILILALFPATCFSQSKKILSQSYSLLGVDRVTKKLVQSNDTLYEFHCFIDRPCVIKPEKHYKILSIKKANEFTVLKLEQLDTIPLSSDPYPAKRFYVLAFKDINDKTLGYLPLKYKLSKSQLDTITINPDLKNKFFFTFYSEQFIKDFTKFKSITTKADAQLIIQEMNGDESKSLAVQYKHTDTGDIYGSGFSAELLNRACIRLGFSPVGSGRIISALMK